MSWAVLGSPSHCTWSGARREGGLPCAWLADNPLRLNFAEFGNHT